MSDPKRWDDPNVFAVTIGLDALRAAIGIAPRNHDIKTICRWLRCMDRRRTQAGKGEPA